MSNMTPTDFRLRLLRTGFHPLPLFGKAPLLKNWQEKFATNSDEIKMWPRQWADAINTGVLTKYTPAIDIDILHPEAAAAVEALTRERFEEKGCILPRFGKAPKRAILFRTDEPFSKIIANLIAPDGTPQKIEFLANGQQVVVDGIHPETHRPYSWHGAQPGEIEHDQLPYITGGEAQRLVDDAAQLLVEQFGFKRADSKKKSDGKGHDGDENTGTPADWNALIGNIVAGASLHDSQRDLIASLVAKGYNDGDTANLLRALMRSSTAPRDDRWLERYNEIGELVRSAREKFGEKSATVDLQSILRAYAPRAFSEIPRRRWLHAGHYVRQQLVMTVAPGGWGKTALVLCNALEMCTRQGLLGPRPLEGPLRVLYWNAEDPEDEVERRIAALCIHYKIDAAELADLLFLGSKISGERLGKVDRKTGEIIINKPLFATVEQFIADNKIDCAVFDPLVAFHSIPEGDNGAMEKFLKAGFEHLATAHNCCVELSVHTKKGNPGEITADDTRGASAQTYAARSVRVLNRMSGAEAEMPKIEPEERRHYLRVSRDKTNLAPPGKATWIHLAGIELPNGDDSGPGDNVHVAVCWDYPQAFAGVSADDMRFARNLVRDNPDLRADPRSPEWIGIPLAARLKLDPDDKGDRKQISAIIRTWIINKVLAVETRPGPDRHKRQYVVVGPWTDDAHDSADPL